ncbi:OmpA family protein [Pontibacter sp. KCTC 32443]|uniref:OmpA family protein n=1 Tax=Pontibacter TaxID=323449 RepID=UPI00164EBC4E|nr:MULTISPECIES: OmpA family protein [Pontibacter]MBC5775746.1 OmpA family protein [Pontibacter sp. KCTC 32443]
MIHHITRNLRLALILLGLVLTFLQTAKAQDLQKADKHFNEFEFSLALDEYKAILDQGEPSLTVVQRIADIYRILNNSKEAEFWYAQVITFAGADPSAYYLYAESAKRNGNYEKAKLLFLEYSNKVPGQAVLAQRMAASCDTSMEWIRDPKPFKVWKEKTLNSQGADFSPFKAKDGLYFASDRLVKKGKEQVERYGWTGNGYIQMYYAPAKSDTTWSNPTALPSSINTAYHNGPGVFHEKDQTLYFTRTRAVRREVKKNSDPTSWFKGAEGGTHINRLGIYTASKKGNKWKKGKAFKYNNTDQFSIGHPAITTDGNVLYFVSDMPGGLGETDIYYSERQPNGEWSEPINAGNKINTTGRESFPSIGADGVLYFSSDGHMGMGGLDLFKAVGAHKAWTTVENMKYPFNTSHDDLGLVMDASGKTGMLSSGRLAEDGFDDILSFVEERIPCTIAGKTIEFVPDPQNRGKKKELTVGNVRLQITEERSNAKPIEIESDKDGNFTFPVFAGGKYTIRGSKPNYLTQTITVSPDCRNTTDSVMVEMVFNRDTPNKPIVLENIYYDLDKYEITAQAAVELDKLVQTLKDNPSIVIELSSHTDSRQTNYYNQMLSDLRAQAAVDYLVLKGIDRNRLVAKGYGETQLLNKCKDGVSCPEDMHQENRRTEFKIIRKVSNL